MNAAVIVWPGGEHPFRLALAQLEGLQKATDCGPEWLAMKLRSGQWLSASLYGPADDPAGKPSLAGETTPNPSAESGSLAPTTD